MPSLFGRKKPSTPAAPTPPPSSEPKSEPNSHPRSLTTEKPSPPVSPDKKSRGYFVREREKDSRPKPSRSSKSFGRTSVASRRPSDSHPLNLPPDELRRLSSLRVMSSPREDGFDGRSDPMETTPAPEAPPGAFPMTNGVNRGQHKEEGPEPPPHGTPKSPSPQQEPKPEPKVDAEACKAAGNKFYKAGQYGKAIDEYTKGLSLHVQRGIATLS